MKLWHGIAIVVGLALIAWGIFALVKPGGELGSNKEVATQKPSSYTADQVITIAQAKYPACYKYEGTLPDRHVVQTQPSITVNYIGGDFAAWKVEINCPSGYYLENPTSGINSTRIYFYETDGSLTSAVRGWNPLPKGFD